MAGEPREIWARVQVASFDTLHVRAVRTDKMELPKADVVIVDEAHLSISATRQNIISSYPDAVIIGLTATPARGDGRGLGEIYDVIVPSWPMRKLIDHGYLVEPRYFAGEEPDLEEIGIGANGDYIVEQLAGVMDRPKLVGDIVDNWERIASDRSTIVFATNVAHSLHLQEEFQRRGYTAEHIDANTDLGIRAGILKRVETGETQVLCNVFIGTYGLDVPRLSCAVLARPTRSLVMFLQSCGRVLRTHDTKEDAIIIDHSGIIAQHGFLDDPINWTLDGNVREEREKEKKEKGEPKEITCPNCSHVFKGQRECPECGAMIIPKGKPIPVHQADLVEIKRDKAKTNREWDMTEKSMFLAELRGYAHWKGWKEGWASHMYKEKFGVWPNKVAKRPPIQPTMETLQWIKHINIKKAKSRDRKVS
jgi:superfamily II DNA or RNA helicase